MVGGRLTWTLTTVVALVVTAGCATSGRPTPAAPPAAPDAVVMVIRHGEKPDGSDHGVDAQGKKDNSSLTATGWDRAKGLVNLFAPAQGALPARAGPPQGDLRGGRERRRRRHADPGDRRPPRRRPRLTEIKNMITAEVFEQINKRHTKFF